METPELHLPYGWFGTGTGREHYEMGVTAPGVPALIRSRTGDAGVTDQTFATLMQSIVAGDFRGRRLRLRAELKADDVHGAETIWMRVDGGPKRMLAFDNLEQRAVDGALHGSSDWTLREVVLDVPAEAESIHYGFYLRGSGRAWARNFELASVASDVAVTTTQRLLDHPTNLDFSRIAGAD